MASVFKIKEIQLGLIILFSFYVFSLLSELDLGMTYSHEMITYISLLFIIILLINLRIILSTPHKGILKLNSKNDTWFISSYKIIYFIMFFTVCTLISTLIAYAIPMDRSQDIFTLGMLISNIYYIFLSFWVSYNFIMMSAIGENMEFAEKKI